ncbi:hypothetical protein [Adlercreutzia sp. ZJ242]|uniref:hypothetical protein n=1 Tax=Adlercreutzia sp. ZJ242 TaxID=2709409 RepID=UPI0013E9FF5E|nr:hypothetical protein [Adlercreutzia sp. ZJ242]
MTDEELYFVHDDRAEMKYKDAPSLEIPPRLRAELDEIIARFAVEDERMTAI